MWMVGRFMVMAFGEVLEIWCCNEGGWMCVVFWG